MRRLMSVAVWIAASKRAPISIPSSIHTWYMAPPTVMSPIPSSGIVSSDPITS